MGPNGLAPLFLLFGVLPSFTAPSNSKKSPGYSLKALQKETSEMGMIIFQARIRTALNAKIPHKDPEIKYACKGKTSENGTGHSL